MFLFVCLFVFPPADKVLDSCSFRDEDDDCTYHYTVENPKDKDLEVQVLKKKGEQHHSTHDQYYIVSSTDLTESLYFTI